MTEDEQSDGENLPLVTEDESVALSRAREIVEEMQQLADQRSAINDQLAGKRNKLKTMGFNVNGVKAAMRYLDMSPEQRRNYDQSYARIRDAFSEPLQADLPFAGAKADDDE